VPHEKAELSLRSERHYAGKPNDLELPKADVLQQVIVHTSAWLNWDLEYVFKQVHQVDVPRQHKIWHKVEHKEISNDETMSRSAEDTVSTSASSRVVPGILRDHLTEIHSSNGARVHNHH
jgi:hypothetical protein